MEPAAVARLIDLARGGDEHALGQLFELHRPRLLRMIELRLDASLRRRLDPADVVQEAWLDARQRFAQWCQREELPFHVWLRLVTAQALTQAQRRHLAAHMRDALREVSAGGGRTDASATNAADVFLASATSPTQAVRREEVRASVLKALDELDEIDREVVALRHFEGLSNDEVASELALTPAAASKRFLRALVRLRPALQALGPETSGGGS